MGHSLGPVHIGVRFHVPGPSRMTDLGCRVLPSMRRSQSDQPTIRSHPNKAVDVTSNQAWRNACLADQQTDLSSGCYAAAVWVIDANEAWPRGSYTSPLIQSRWSKTASFRATATVARFLAFFPPRSHSFFPNRRKSVSGPNGPRM